MLRAAKEVDPAEDILQRILLAVQTSTPLVARIVHSRMCVVESKAVVVPLVQLAVDASEDVLDGERTAILAWPDRSVPTITRVRSFEVEDA